MLPPNISKCVLDVEILYKIVSFYILFQFQLYT